MDLVGGDKINKAKLADGWEEKDGEGKEEVGKKEKSRDISFQNVIRLSSF